MGVRSLGEIEVVTRQIGRHFLLSTALPSGSSKKPGMKPLNDRRPSRMFRFERGLGPRNRILGEASEGGRRPPPSYLVARDQALAENVRFQLELVQAVFDHVTDA